MITRILQTPNITKGFVLVPKGVVLHHTAGSFAGSVSWCMNPQSKVSYHAIVNIVNGEITQLAKDNQRVWANGVSSFKGRRNCNDFMLSIAVCFDTNTRTLNHKEITSVAQWCKEKMNLYGFDIDNITTHRFISPGRKNDLDLRAERAILEELKIIINS